MERFLWYYINGRVIGSGIYYDYQQPLEQFLTVP